MKICIFNYLNNCFKLNQTIEYEKMESDVGIAAYVAGNVLV